MNTHNKHRYARILRTVDRYIINKREKNNGDGMYDMKLFFAKGEKSPHKYILYAVVATECGVVTAQ